MVPSDQIAADDANPVQRPRTAFDRLEQADLEVESRAGDEGVVLTLNRSGRGWMAELEIGLPGRRDWVVQAHACSPEEALNNALSEADY